MPQVVDASNLLEFTTTGKVADFKPPEAPKADIEAKKQDAASPARDDAGKFTKQNEPAKSETAAAPKKEIADEDLSEVVRQKINAKHRQAKEAEERERRETLRALQAEERAERLQKQLDAQSQKSGPATSDAPKEPKPDDFKTVAEYTDALVNYRVEQRFLADKAKAEREAAEREKEARQQEFGKRIAAAKTTYDDFEDVLGSIKGTDLDRVHSDVTEYIQESEQGAHLLYHLAKNPDVLGRLRTLSPRRFIAELGKLETKWESPAEKGKQETAPTLTEVAAPIKSPVSKAPAPIVPLDSAGIAPVAKKPEDMSVQELREYRRNQEREKHAARR
jgi:hypothetical protein